MSSKLLYEKIAGVIEDGITKGKYQIGEKLPSERELSKQFNISRNVIRESVKLLKEKGLVEVVQGKGSYVSHHYSANLIGNVKRIMKYNNGKLQDIVEIREMLEKKIVELAVDRATIEQIKHLEMIVERMKEEIDNSKQIAALDLEFHITLAKCTQNPLFLELMNTISVLLDETIYLLMTLFPQTKMDGISHHEQIVKAIKKRDKKLVKMLITEHLLLVRNEMEQVSSILENKLKYS